MLIEDLTADIAPVLADIAWDTPVVSMAPRWHAATSVAHVQAATLGHAAPLAFAPSPLQRWNAAARLRLALMAETEPSGANRPKFTFGLQRLICDANLRARADDAMSRAAVSLRMAGKPDIVSAMHLLGLEHAAVEALRHAVLLPLQHALQAQLGVPFIQKNDAAQHRVVQQSKRRIGLALARVSSAFTVMDSEVEAELDDILDALANAPSRAKGLRRLIQRVEVTVVNSPIY